MMPLYEYECCCGNKFEAFRSYELRNHAKCPECQSTKVTKLISSINFDKDTKYKDLSGEKVWFPKDERPYFDEGLRKTFNNVKEKKQFMDKHGVVSHGSSQKGLTI